MSALAVIVAVGSYWYTEWRRSREDQKRDEETIRQVGFKLWRVVNGIHDLHRHLWAELPKLADGRDELWKRIQPMIGLQRDQGLTLDAAEVSLLLRMKQSDLLMDMSLLTGRYESMLSSMIEYRTRFDAFHAMLPPPDKMEGSVAVRMMTEDEFRRLQPYSVLLENLIVGIRAMTKENVALGEKLVDQLSKSAEAHFGRPVIKLEMLKKAE